MIAFIDDHRGAYGVEPIVCLLRFIVWSFLKAKPSSFWINSMGQRLCRTRETPVSDHGKWGLATDRANAVRQILEAEGYPSANFYKVAGKADTDPLFPEEPTIAPNRRVTITLVREASPVPPNLQP